MSMEPKNKQEELEDLLDFLQECAPGSKRNEVRERIWELRGTLPVKQVKAAVDNIKSGAYAQRVSAQLKE